MDPYERYTLDNTEKLRKWNRVLKIIFFVLLLVIVILIARDLLAATGFMI